MEPTTFLTPSGNAVLDTLDGETRSEIDFIALCYEFPPWLLAGAIWTEKLLSGLHNRGWRFEVVTAASGGRMFGVPVHSVPNPGPPPWLSVLGRASFGKFREWWVWPDEAVYWKEAAHRFARELIRNRKPQLLVNFMMPYGAGLVGEKLAAETGLPLVYCFSDSHSCTDMHSSFPTYFHYRHARALEDRYVQAASAVVYVSQFNADLVKSRQPVAARGKFHTIRLGAEPSEFAPLPGVGPDPAGPLRVVYIGSMGGWYDWYKRRPTLSWVRRAWGNLGRHRVARLDHRTHSPVYIGKAVQKVVAARPDWRGKIFVDVYGSRIATEEQIAKVLEVTGVKDVVRVHGPQSREEIGWQTRTADVLFQCVQNRVGNTPGGRIASKTYEYLMTDRPILAAVPKGENWDFYDGKPGVSLVLPDDVDGMARAIAAAAQAKFDRHETPSINRSTLRDDLNYAHRAQQLEAVLDRVLKERTNAKQ